MNDPLVQALETHFGFSTFHKGQRAVIEDVLSGRPTVAVMPTGAGKSLCYQLPALLLPGVTVVVSPLIALMKDQVDSLRRRGVPAAFVNSSQAQEEQEETLFALASGALKLVYVAPERFRHRAFVRALEEARPALFAIDEAHCISRWGHDFRPDYVRLGEVVARLKPPRLLACTATATEEVRADILKVLGLPDAQVHVAGFLRENLFLEARLVSGDKERERRVAGFLTTGAGKAGSVILYASTRKRVERFGEVCRNLLGAEQVVIYHGGLDDDARTVAQERFMSGRARVAVATNAFGMGVDRSGVRAVVHLDLPRTLEGYYQEVGRAGRDGEPSVCLLLYHAGDTRVHEFLIDQSHPDPQAFVLAWRLLQAVPVGFGLTVERLDALMAQELKHSEKATGGVEGVAEPVLRQFSRVDALQTDGRVFRPAQGAPADVTALGLDFDELRLHREHELAKMASVRRFAASRVCRHRFVLDYFGEGLDRACPGCDRCHPSRAGDLEADTPSEEEVLLVRKALAGVARAAGRYGVVKVAGMLAGDAEVGASPLGALSTFGLLKELGVERASGLLRLLKDQGLCESSADEYPTLTLTEAGWAVMQGRLSIDFKLPERLLSATSVLARRREALAPKGRAGAGTLLKQRSLDAVDADQGVVAALRAFRAKAAREGCCPPYVIFDDRSLLALASAKPQTKSAFLALPGLGATRWERHGPAILEAIQRALGD